MAAAMTLAVAGNAQTSEIQNHVSSKGAISTVPGNQVSADIGTRSTIYYTANFDTSWNGWTAEIQSGNVGFELTTTGHANSAGSSFAIPALASTSEVQWVVLDSDAKGASGTEENATLTSPILDLSEPVQNGVPLAITFDQFFAEWTDPVDELAYVEASTDSGVTWHGVTVNDGVGRDNRPNPERIYVNLTELIAGGDSSQVQIRFRWYGSWNYGWQIDNVNIEEMANFDGEVAHVWRERSDFLFNSYWEIPITQAPNLDTVSAIFMNNGGFELKDFDVAVSVVGSTSGEVATGSTTIASLGSLKRDTVGVPVGFQPTTQETFTTHVYLSNDEVAGNDSGSSSFQITEYHYSHYKQPTAENESVWNINHEGEGSIGSVFRIVADQDLHFVEFKFGPGMALGADYFLMIKEVLTGIQDVSDLYEGTFQVTADDTSRGAGWVSFPLTEPQALVAGNYYIAEILSYDAQQDPISIRTNVDGNGDRSATAYGPFGTNKLVNRFYGWQFTPAIRLNFEPVSSVEDLGSLASIRCFPNPASQIATLSYSTTEDAIVDIILSDATGREIENWTVHNLAGEVHAIDYNVAGLENGVYFFTITEGLNSTTRKVTIAK